MRRALFLLLLFVSFASCSPKEVHYSSPESLRGATVAVALGSPQDAYVSQNYPEAKIMRLESMSELPIVLESGSADFAISDRAVSDAMFASNKNLMVVDDNFMPCDIAAGFHLSRADLRDAYDRFLDKFIGTATYNDIVARWEGSGEGGTIPHIEMLEGKPTIKVGVSSLVPPFCVIKDNELQGLSIEMIKHFALNSGYTLEFMDMNFPALLAALQSGKIDVLDCGFIVSEERKERAHFTQTYYTGTTVVMARKPASKSGDEFPAEEYSHKLLESSRVAVLMGSTSDMYATNNLPDAKIVRVEGLGDYYPMLQNNYADYMIADIPNIANMQVNAPELKIVDSMLFEIGVAAAFPKDNTALCSDFNEFLSKFQPTDEFAQMQQRWLVEGDIDNIPEIGAHTSGKKIVVAVDPNNFPCTSIVNNKLDGFEIELARRFAYDYGYVLEFMQCNFSAVISALATSKADMGIATICVTEERKKSILFSEPYNSVATGVAQIVKSREKYLPFEHPEIQSSVEGEEPTTDDIIKGYIRNGIATAVEGTVQEQYLSSLLPAEQVAIAKDHSDALLTLTAGKAQYILSNLGTARNFCKRQESVEIILQDLFTYSTCYGINKNNPSLREEIDAFLKSREADGSQAKLYDKWLTELDDAQMEQIEFAPDAPVLRVGSSCTAMPFNFLKDGQARGLDIETLALFCREAGYRMEIVEMPFGALVSAITTGKVDVIANTLSPTAERREKVDFTRAYGHNCFAMLTNRVLNDAQDDGEQKVGVFKSIATSFERNILAEKRYKLILDGVWVTLIISILSIIVGTLVGAGVCSLTMSQSKTLRYLGQGYVTIIRGTPVLVILMINFYVIFSKVAISPVLVATISFAMNFGAYVSEMFRASIMGVDKGQREAGLAMGFTKVKTFVLIIAPQAIKSVLPIFKGEAISLVKMTSIVGYIAVQDITKVGDIIRSRTFDAFFPLLVSALLYFLISYLFAVALDLLTSKITRRN